MNVDIYRSISDPDAYLTVPAGTKLDALELPDDMATAFASADVFATGIEMKADQPRVGMKPQEILADIERQGFAAHRTRITVTFSSAPQLPST